MATKPREDKGTMDEVRELLRQGYTQKEIVDKGYAKATVSEVKQDMESRGELPTNEDNHRVVPVRGLPLEAIIENIEVPNLNCREFKKTVKFVLDFVVFGVRMAQELSAMGVQQGRPLIEMAKEMRMAEGQLAQAAQQSGAEAAQAAARQAAMGVGQQVVQTMKEIAKAQAPNPLLQDFANTVRPYMQGLMIQLMGGLMPGFKPPTPGTPSGGQAGQRGNEASADEMKEVFGDGK